MPNFDVSNYLANRLSQASQDKRAEIFNAAEAKKQEIDARYDGYAASQQNNEGSWVNDLGLKPGSFTANRVNDAASLVSGATRLAGQVASLPASTLDFINRSGLTQQHYDAYNRYKTNQLQPGDMGLLGAASAPGQSPLELFQAAEQNRGDARAVNNFFDTSKIVDQTNRQRLNADLGKNFDADWAKVTEGWDAAKKGNMGEAALGMTKGVASLMASAGKAIASNPSAVREYVLENAPQLALGLYGKAGQAAMAASNVGYAVDTYQQGIENYAKANNGQLPPEDVRNRMAIEAASLALAEEAGDLFTLGAAKSGGGAVKGILKASAGGALSEAPTEGYQTWAEGDITGKPATAKDIYTGAVIGGAAGAGLAGSIQTVSAAGSAAGEARDKVLAEKAKQVDFADAVETGDVSKLPDPLTAVQALKAHAGKEGKTTEEKQAAFESAGQVVESMAQKVAQMKDALGETSKEGLEKQLAAVNDRIAKADPTDTEMASALAQWRDGIQNQIDKFDAETAGKRAVALKEQIAKAEDQVTQANDALRTFHGEIQDTDVNVEEEAKKITAEDPATSQATADKIINLSMATPGRLTAELAETLSKHESLTDAQREYFRTFSPARVAENALQKMGDVSKQVYFGKPADTKMGLPRMLGIKDYRNDMAVALASGNRKSADALMKLLGNFVADHDQKAELAAQAYADFKKDGIERRLVSLGNGQWEVKEGKFDSGRARIENGGVDIYAKSAKLPAEIRTESDALKAAQAELSAAYNLKFGGSNVENVSPAPRVQESKEQQAKATPEASAKDGAASDEQGAAEPDVQSNEPADTVEKTEAARVTEEAPASSVNAEETESTETTPVETQSTQESTTVEDVPEAAPATDEVQTGTLVATTEKAEAGAKYQELKFGDLFTQSKGSEKAGSLRPLVAVKGFLSQLASGAVNPLDFLKDKTALTDIQRGVLTKLQAKFADWAPAITADLKPTHNTWFNHEDPIRYLIGENKDVEENVKTAMVVTVFAYLAEQANRQKANDAKAINRILGRPEDSAVSQDAIDELAEAGNYQPILADSLGGKVMEVLGIKPNGSVAGQEMGPLLRVSLGAHVLKLMEDQGLIVRHSVSNLKMAQLRSQETVADELDENGVEEEALTTDRSGHHFYRITWDGNYQPAGKVKEITDAMYQSKSVLQNLFGLQHAVQYPTLEAKTTAPSKTDTGMGVPNIFKKAAKQDQSIEWKMRRDELGILSLLDVTDVHTIIGVTPISEKTVHADDVKGTRAKNENLIREYNQLVEFMGETLLTNEGGLDTAFHLESTVQTQQRMGIATTGVNPQGSKVVRGLIAPDAWNTTIKFSDAVMLTNFLLRVGEGFGIKPEKRYTEKSIAQLREKLQDPVIIDGIKVVQHILYNKPASLTDEQKAALLKTVAKGKQKMYTVNAMVAYAHFLEAAQTARENGQPDFEFTTNLTGEVDGISNGSAFNMTLYGAAATSAGLSEELEKVGVYTLNSQYRQYNEWRDDPKHTDVYESAAKGVDGYINWMLKKDMVPAELIAAIWETRGRLSVAEEVTSEGRDLMKSGINPLNYGSGLRAIMNKVSNSYLESIREKFTEFSASTAPQEDVQAELDAYVTNLNIVLQAGGAKPLPVGKPAGFYMGYKQRTLSSEQMGALLKVYGETVGKAATSVVKRDFADLLSRSRNLVQGSNLAHALYKAVFDGARADMIKALGLPTHKDGTPVHDLTAEQEQKLQDLLKDILPVMHSAASAQEDNLANGELMMKKERVADTRPMYQAEVGFGTPLSTGSKQMTIPGRSIQTKSPGVSMLANTTQSGDSLTSASARTEEGMVAQNNHDALNTSVGLLPKTAENLNKHFFLTTLNYSPLHEGYEGLMRVVQGIVAYEKAGHLSEQTKQNIRDAVTALSEKSEFDADFYVDVVTDALFKEAVRAEDTKLGSMENWAVVDQYAFEGGSYALTDKDRQAVIDKRDTLQRAQTETDAQLLADFSHLFYGTKPEQKAPLDNQSQIEAAFGELGQSNIESDADLVSFFKGNPEATIEQVKNRLATPGRLSPVNRKLLELAFRALQNIDPGLKIRFITPSTDPKTLLALPKQASRGWYIATADGKSEIYVLSPEFKNSGLTSETLLHEFVHAALARTIANPSKATGAAALVLELETLLAAAQKYVTDNGLESAFGAAVADVQELVAWGMTNRDFQQQVLNRISVPSKTAKYKLIEGMKKFIDTLTRLLFRPDAEIHNGMAVLISNTSGLFAEAAKTKTRKETDINQSQASQNDMTPLQVLQALDTGALGADFQEHLGKVLSGMANAVYGPFGAFRDAVKNATANDPLAAWTKMIETGVAPFASDLVNSAFAATPQETFVMEQVEATVAKVFEINDISTKPAYRELVKLYNEAQSTLTVKDFENAGLTAADYNFVFAVNLDSNNRSNYLSRFAALGLASEKFKDLMSFKTEAGRANLGNQKSWFDRMMKWFEQILSYFNHKATNTFAGQAGDDKIGALVDRLMDIEAKHRLKAQVGQSKYGLYAEKIEEGTKAAFDKAKTKLVDFAKSPLVAKSKSGVVLWAGAITRVMATGRSQAFMQQLRSLRDHATDERDGMWAGLLRELKGPSDLLEAMILIRKHSEQTRQTAIAQTGDVLIKEFEANGRTLSKEEKKALTAVLLRTGAHNLTDQFSLAEIAQMLDSPTDLNQAITDVEASLSTSLKELHINQANGLGYWRATDIDGVSFLMKNAHVIARMLGTQFEGQITEAQAAQEEAKIAKLATLYAFRYSSFQDRKHVAAVMKEQNQRQDGNGTDLMLKVHRDMEQESMERLFDNNPIQMTHGYVPEIYDPYVTIKIANEIDGKALMAQGFKQGESVSSDKHVPDANGVYGLKQHIYIRRDGGLNRRVSGGMSLTNEHHKGTTIHDGYMNANTAIGAWNQSLQLSVTNAKLAELAATTNPRRDLSKSKDVHVAPIYDDAGKVVNWAHMMSGRTKDNILKRESRFEKVMGVLAGSIVDKHTTKDLNEKAITALKDQYDLEKNMTPWSYVEVGAQSSAPEMRELWFLLPEATRIQARKIWGTNAMMVRKDSLDGVFGYRKISTADFLLKERADLKGISRMARTVFHALAKYRGMGDDAADDFAKRMGTYVIMGERGWQEIYKVVKDVIVVKSGVVLLGNIYSNASLLWALGVKDGWSQQFIALRGIMAYEEDHKRLMELETKLGVGYAGIDAQAAELEIGRLKDSIARNPVTKLVDAGLKPSIVEDVDLADDPYSYETALEEGLAPFTKRIPQGVKTVAKNVWMSHDTPIYKVLSRATQYSDFVARYALYEHLTNTEGKSHEEAIKKSLAAFVHYDVPMQRNLQYLDDMGFTPFMKYFYRIQRVLLDAMKERPARVLSMVLMNRIVDLGPIVLDSALISHVGNMPLRGGATQIFDVPEKLLTINSMAALVK